MEGDLGHSWTMRWYQSPLASTARAGFHDGVRSLARTSIKMYKRVQIQLSIKRNQGVEMAIYIHIP